MKRFTTIAASILFIVFFYTDFLFGQQRALEIKNPNINELQTNSNAKTLGSVVAGFTTPDQICINTPVQITNTSSGASSYYWTFCAANFTGPPDAVNLGNTGGQLNGPVFTDIAQDNSGNYFVFSVNNYSSQIVRMNFGNSLLNTPVTDNLGNFAGAIPPNAEGIQLVNVGGNWIAIVVGGDPVSGNPSSVAKINFGTSLASTTPTAVNWGNVGGLSYPCDLYVFNEAGNWYGYTINSRNNTVTQFNFGSDFSTLPTGVNLGNLGNMNSPVGMGAINSGGNWYIFITNNTDGSLSRLSFGNSLLNTPISLNIGNPGGSLGNPRDISFINLCNGTEAFVGNAATNTITKLDFGTNLLGNPIPTSLGNVGNLSFPHSLSKLFRVNNDIYSFIPNVNNNTITRVRFAGCSLPGSTVQNPAPIVYSQPGIYDINLLVDVGLPTQTSFCKQIVVTDCASQTCNNWLGLPSFPSFVQVGDLDVPGDQITVEAVFNRTSPYTGGPLFAGDLVSKHKDPVNVNYLLRPNDAEITTTDGVYHIAQAPCEISLDKVYHVAMVYDGVTLKFYRNGFLQAQTPVTGNLFQNDFPTQIGLFNAELYNTNLIGYINEVRIWNVARSQTQIQTYMNTSLPSPPTQPGLLAYYTFNDLLNKQGNPAWNGTLGGQAAILQTNPNCNFTPDNDCCPPITGLFTGNSICPGQTGLLSFHPTSTPTNPPYTISYSDQINSYTQSNVQDGISFAVPVNPVTTTVYPLLKITDADNCATTVTAESATITVNIPANLSITPDTSICRNGMAQLNVSGGQNYTWSPAIYLTNANISNPVAQISQTTRFYVTGTDFNNCNVQDSVTVNILPSPVFQAPPDQKVCNGLSVVLDGANGKNYLYSWSPATALDNPNSPAPVASPDQTTIYNLTISDPVCNQYDSTFNVQVVVNQTPQIIASKSNDINCSTLTSHLSVTGADFYSWVPEENLDNPNSANPIARLPVTTQFIVKGTSTNGCYSYDSLTVNVSETGENAFAVPNAFTPNGDGINDCFGIRNWGSVTLQQFSIYNRWGQCVFETKNPSECWDGTFQGQKQDTGGFVYIIKASSLCGNIVRKGNVLLIR
jgi:gliding motility-associated-like protein